MSKAARSLWTSVLIYITLTESINSVSFPVKYPAGININSIATLLPSLNSLLLVYKTKHSLYFLSHPAEGLVDLCHVEASSVHLSTVQLLLFVESFSHFSKTCRWRSPNGFPPKLCSKLLYGRWATNDEGAGWAFTLLNFWSLCNFSKTNRSKQKPLKHTSPPKHGTFYPISCERLLSSPVLKIEISY